MALIFNKPKVFYIKLVVTLHSHSFPVMCSSSGGARRGRGEVLGVGVRHQGHVLAAVRGRARQEDHPRGHAAVGTECWT